MVQIHPYIRPDQAEWLKAHKVQMAELIRRLLDEAIEKDMAKQHLQ